jgi:polysaccharide deacetylase 2 family uncharacterized protein YibQ
MHHSEPEPVRQPERLSGVGRVRFGWLVVAIGVVAAGWSVMERGTPFSLHRPLMADSSGGTEPGRPGYPVPLSLEAPTLPVVSERAVPLSSIVEPVAPEPPVSSVVMVPVPAAPALTGEETPPSFEEGTPAADDAGGGPSPREVAPESGGPERAVRPDPVQIAVVIDDLGYQTGVSLGMARLPLDVTLAVMPGGPSSRQVVDVGRALGKEIILHQPMEPRGYPRTHPGPLALLSGMGEEEIVRILRANLARFPEVVGVNNHMGSRLTTDAEAMGSVMKVLAGQGLFFLDSQTTPETVAWREAGNAGIPYARRHVFLDNDPQRDVILGQLRTLERVARKRGGAVGIGHPYSETLDALQVWQKEVRERNIHVVRVSRLLSSVVTPGR